MRNAALLIGAAFAAAAIAPSAEERQAFTPPPILGRGINLGGALEAPSEGAWGVTLKPDYFQAIKAAGFDSVRIPIRWSAHALPTPPYTIAPPFLARVDAVVGEALSRGMSAVLDLHHYVNLYKDPDAEEPRLLALWSEIAAHYRNFPDRLLFELVNEPFDQLTDERWQAMIPQLLGTIRSTNPTRMIVVGPGFWNSLTHLDNLHLPEDDRHLLVTFHYYVPMNFTHQGASWVAGSAQWMGTTWTGSPSEMATLHSDFAQAAAWGERNRRPLYLGEFGAYEKADMDSRARWTAAVAREAEAHGMSWAYWEFASTFGAYDPKANAWRQPLLTALMPDGKH